MAKAVSPPEKRTSAAPEPGLGAGALFLWVLVLGLSAVPHLFILDQPFAIEDYLHVGEAEHITGPAAALGHATETEGAVIRFFRPVLHADLWLERALFGPDPRALHAMGIAWHLLSTLLLMLVVRRFTADPAEKTTLPPLCGMIFGIMPGKIGAVAWIAARGDVFVLIGAATAFLGFERRRAGRPLGRLLQAIGVSFALFAKETGALLIPLLLVMEFAPGPRFEAPFLRRARNVFFIAVLPGAIWFFLRKSRLGDAGDVYLGVPRTFTPEVFRRMLEDLPQALAGLISGSYRRIGFFLTGDPRPPAVLSALFLFVAAAMRSAAFRRRAGPLLLLIALACALPMRFYREGGGVEPSRFFYAAAAPFALLGARAIHALMQRPGVLRGSAIGASAILLVLWTVAGADAVKTHRAAADLMRALPPIIDAARAIAGSDAEVHVVGLPGEWRGVPLYGRFIGHAFAPPFRHERVPITSLRPIDDEKIEEAVDRSAVPIIHIAFDERAAAYRPFGILPAPQKAPIAIERAPDGSFGVTPAAAVRDLKTLVITLEDQNATAADFELRFRLLPAPEVRERSGSADSRPNAAKDGAAPVYIRRIREHADVPLRKIVLRPTADPVWRLVPNRTTRIDVIAADGRTVIKDIAVQAALPRIGVLGPATGEKIDARGPEPVFRFVPVPDARFYRLVFDQPARFARTVDAKIAVTNAGEGALRLSMIDALGVINFTWSSIDTGGGSNILRALGVRAVEFTWHIEAMLSPDGSAIAESPRRTAVIFER